MRTENIVLAEKSDILTVISAFFPEEVLEPDFADKGYYHNNEETRTLAVFDLSAVYTDTENDLHIIFTWYGVSALRNNHIKEMMEKTHKITELTAKNEELQKAFDSCYSNLCYQNQIVQIYRERHAESEKGKEAFEKKALDILESKRNEIRALKNELTEKDTLINSLYNQISNVQYNKKSVLEEIETKYDKLFERYELEVNDNLLLSSKIHELEGEVYNLRKMNEELQEDKDSLDSYIGVLHSIRDDLHDEINAKTEVISALGDSVNDLIEKIESLESEKAELTDIIADSNDCYYTLEEEYNKALDKNEELNEELTEKTNVIIMTKKLIKKLKRQMAKSEGFANELQKKLYEYRSRFGMI